MKKQKTERCRQRNINLVQATAALNALSFLNTSACCHPSSSVASASDAGDAYANDAGGTSAGDAPSSPITDDDPFTAVSGCFVSLVASGGLLSTVPGCPSSSVAGDSLLSAIFVRFSSLVAGGSPLSAVSSDGPLFLVPPTGS